MNLWHGAVVISLSLLFQASLSMACETTSVEIDGILSREAPITVSTPPALDAPIAEQVAASQASITSTVYDSGGHGHSVTALFFHTNVSVWMARVLVDSGELGGGIPGQPFAGGDIGLYFSGNGAREPDLPDTFPDMGVTFAWAGGVRASLIKFAFRPVSELPQGTQLTASQDGRAGACPQYGILDFDGDGTDDFAIWRPSTGMWAVRRSTTGSNVEYIWKQWGLPGDYPMPGDYTGDGLADLVVYRITTGMWYVCRSEFAFDCSYGIGQQFGWPGDRPIRGDFDGDRILDFAVWRPSWQMFFYKSSRTGELIWRQWGLPGDIPLNTGVNQ